MAHRSRRARARILILTLFVAVMLAGAEEGGWVLSGPVALGQTIPWLPLTLTPGATDTRLPTSTSAPLPTWTLAPTPEPVRSTATTTQPTLPPTATTPQPPSLPTSVASPTRSQPVSTASPTQQQPTQVSVHAPSPTQEPASLNLQVLVDPTAAGPGDNVHFGVQVSDVGRGPARNVKIEAALPAALRIGSITCERCTTIWTPPKADPQAPAFLALASSYLPSGDQVVAVILAQVVEDAWPGQTITTTWLVTADGLLPETVQANLELPWAELPATGGSAGTP